MWRNYMKFLFFILVLAITLNGYSRKNDESNGGNVNTNQSTTQFKNIPQNGEFSDIANDSEKEFVDITSAKVSIDDKKISIEITLRNLPSLSFNQPSVNKDVLEYEWGVEFDVDGDNVADYTLSRSYFKGNGNLAVVNILSYGQTNIWKNSSTNSYYLVEASSNLSNNTLLLSVDKSKNSELNKITNASRVKIRAFYTDGIKQYSDFVN